MRPISLWPVPEAEIARLAEMASTFLVVELSNGQMVDDVRLAVDGRRPVHFFSRVGGMIPTVYDLVEQIIQACEEDHVRESIPEAEKFLWAV